jgi:hypothetical protein
VRWPDVLGIISAAHGNWNHVVKREAEKILSRKAEINLLLTQVAAVSPAFHNFCFAGQFASRAALMVFPCPSLKPFCLHAHFANHFADAIPKRLIACSASFC